MRLVVLSMPVLSVPVPRSGGVGWAKGWQGGRFLRGTLPHPHPTPSGSCWLATPAAPSPPPPVPPSCPTLRLRGQLQI